MRVMELAMATMEVRGSGADVEVVAMEVRASGADVQVGAGFARAVQGWGWGALAPGGRVFPHLVVIASFFKN